MKFLSFILALLPISAFALVGKPEDIVENIDVSSKLIQPRGGIVTIVASVIQYAIGIAGILAVIGITWGGIQMVLSTGDDEKLKKGRKMMIYSLVGVVVAGLAYGIVDIVGNFKI